MAFLVLITVACRPEILDVIAVGVQGISDFNQFGLYRIATDEKEKAEVARQHEVAMQAAEEKKKTTFAEVYQYAYLISQYHSGAPDWAAYWL